MVLWIFNHRIGSEVNFHCVLHGFWAARVMGAAYLEAKMHHNLMELR